MLTLNFELCSLACFPQFHGRLLMANAGHPIMNKNVYIYGDDCDGVLVVLSLFPSFSPLALPLLGLSPFLDKNSFTLV